MTHCASDVLYGSVGDTAGNAAYPVPVVDRYAITQRITIPIVPRRVTRCQWPTATALLDMWEHPHSPRHRNFAYFAVRRVRDTRGVEVLDGREG